MAKISRYLSFGLLSAVLMGSSLNAFAASPATQLPDSAVYVQLNTSATHPFEGQLKDFLEKNIQDSDQEIVMKLLSANIESTTLGFSQSYNKSTGADIYMMAFSISEADFKNIIDSADSSELETENLGLNRMLYTAGDDFFFTYNNGNLVASNQKGLVHDLLFTSNSESLSKNVDYQNFISKINPDSFLTGYIDFSKMPEMSEIASMLMSEGFAVNQTSTGFEGKVYVHLKPEANMDGSKYQFTPALYSKVNPADLVFYSESNNLSGHMADSAALLGGDKTILEDIYSEIEQAIGVNVETDIAPLLMNRYAFAVHRDADNTMKWPAASLIADVKGQESLAQTTLEKFAVAMKASLDESGDTTTYTMSNIEMSGTTLRQIHLTDESEDEKQEATITYGITADGILVVTSLTNPADLFALNGLTNDKGWKLAYDGSQVTDVSFLNFMNLKTVINDFPRTEISEAVDTFFAPLHYLATSTTGAANTYWASFKLDLDIAGLDAYHDIFDTIFSEFSAFGTEMGEEFDDYLEEVDYGSNMRTFDDVQSSDWFSPYVSSLHEAYIMNGYGNEFRPNQSITRAEFVKIIIEAMKQNGEDLKEAKFTTNFTDVEIGAWYGAYINTARSNNFIKGYADGSVHPNAPITRAEAMQVLANVDPAAFPVLAGNNRPFQDVYTTDWFYPTVYAVFDAGHINGKTLNTFAPNDNLTRAEAAKIISKTFGYSS